MLRKNDEMQKQLALLMALSMLYPLAARPDAPVVQTPPLRIEVVAGEGGVNSLTTPNVIAPIIRLRTSAGTPVTGAKVRFELSSPAKGSFADGSVALETKTNGRGEASAFGYRPREAGQFVIKVIASSEDASVDANIRQRNDRQPYAIVRQHGWSKRKWVIAAAGAAAAATAVVIATRPKNSSSVTITLGAPTTGGGH